MQQKKTLYDFLYNSLREQILTGCYRYGSPLPSMNRLCDTYHVGIRTVKDVLAALRDEGLIRTEERKAARVIYRPSGAAGDNSILRFVLERRTSIVEVYETISLLLPPLFAFAAANCSLEHLEHYEQFRKFIQKGPGINSRRISSNLFHDLLHGTGSLLLNDLYASLEVYAQVPLVLMGEEDPSYTIPDEEKECITAIAALLPGGSRQEIQDAFSRLYHPAAESIRDYLRLLAERYPDIREIPNAAFTWNSERGRDHYYTQISRDLIDKIGTGFYKRGALLPSEARLSSQYRVSVATVRKALAALNELGFAKTVNGKGSIAVLPDEETTFRCMKDETYKRDTLLYLSALQFMAIAIRPAVQLVFSRMDASRLRNGLIGPDMHLPASMITYILELLPLPPLKTILQESNKLLLWGYYFAFYSNGAGSQTQLKKKSLEAFRYLQERNQTGFTDCLSQCYCHIFQAIRTFLIQGGLSEAKKIVPPDNTSRPGRSARRF
nr:GntR family transcriptional regulator [uncultured Eisenbergiella sp.]